MAFLGGINVGGHNLLKMEDLCQRFVAMGYSGVSSYKQSGNIIFETPDVDFSAIGKGIQGELFDLVGRDVRVFLRTMPQLKKIVRQDPFKDVMARTTKLYVTFLSDEPSRRPKVPLRSPGNSVEIIYLRNRAAFCLCRNKDGRYGYPNDFVEARLGVLATTRSWAVVKGIAASSFLPNQTPNSSIDEEAEEGIDARRPRD